VKVRFSEHLWLIMKRLSSGLPVPGHHLRLNRGSSCMGTSSRFFVEIVRGQFQLVVHWHAATLSRRLSHCPIFTGHDEQKPEEAMNKLPAASTYMP
jgi:hypothetical protein